MTVNHNDPMFAKRGGVVRVDGVEAFSAPNTSAVLYLHDRIESNVPMGCRSSAPGAGAKVTH